MNNKKDLKSYIILMQVPIGTDYLSIRDKITLLCNNIGIDLFLPIDRGDDDSRIDCYIFNIDISEDTLLKKWKEEFPGKAISIIEFIDEFSFFVEKAAEIYHYCLNMKNEKLQDDIRRHLLHYLFNSLGYHYLDEAHFFLNCAEKFIIAAEKLIPKTLIPR